MNVLMILIVVTMASVSTQTPLGTLNYNVTVKLVGSDEPARKVIFLFCFFLIFKQNYHVHILLTLYINCNIFVLFSELFMT